MNLKYFLLSALGLIASTTAVAQYAPAGDKIKTPWAETIDVNNVRPEYPRPIMERDSWKNLNGLWDYAIAPKGSVEPAK